MAYNEIPARVNVGTIHFPLYDDNYHTWRYEGKKLAIDNNLNYLTNSENYNQGNGTLCLYHGALGITPAAIKNYKQYRNNTIVIDLIPVRIGNVGYMFDKVSGQLFGNAGSGSFILGPDII